jgi:hypothetical protein
VTPDLQKLVFLSGEEKKECHNDIANEIERMIAQVELINLQADSA